MLTKLAIKKALRVNALLADNNIRMVDWSHDLAKSERNGLMVEIQTPAGKQWMPLDDAAKSILEMVSK
jgi:hypothetical protein